MRPRPSADHAPGRSEAGLSHSAELVPGWLGERAQPVLDAVARHAMAAEALVAAVISTASLAGLIAQGRAEHPDTIAFCLLLPLALPLRRRARRLTFALIAAVALVQWFVSTPQLADAAVLVAFFWVTLDGELGEMAFAGAVMEIGAVLAALRWSPQDPAKVWVAVTGLAVAAGALGLLIRERRALMVSVRERAARLEFERDQQGRLGAAGERARIAREMHDIVSHNLTVMIGLADGAGYAFDDAPETARDAIGRVSATGRQALGEMRRLLGVLREGPEAGSFEPQPSLNRLDHLLMRVEAAGVPVSIAVQGDVASLPSGVQLAIFRVAQEALTNTLKHAGRPASAHLHLRCFDGRVELEVTDTGLPPQAAQSSSAPELPSGGRGISGMRERALAYDGELQAGPRPNGGWRVRLILPCDVRVGEER